MFNNESGKEAQEQQQQNPTIVASIPLLFILILMWFLQKKRIKMSTALFGLLQANAIRILHSCHGQNNNKGVIASVYNGEDAAMGAFCFAKKYLYQQIDMSIGNSVIDKVLNQICKPWVTKVIVIVVPITLITVILVAVSVIASTIG